MDKYLNDYKLYLENDCRFTSNTIVKYLGNLPAIFDNFSISDLKDIDSRKVSTVWRTHRWEATQKGIQLSKSNKASYLLALKEFLRYLEDRGFIGDEKISTIINIPDNSPKKVRSLNQTEQNKLREYLLFNVANDSQRRETALILLLLATAWTISEVLSLNVHQEGIIKNDEIGAYSGNFYHTPKGTIINPGRTFTNKANLLLPEETVNFINFYLENRKHSSPIIFFSNVCKNPPLRLGKSTAQNVIEKVFNKAGLYVRKGLPAEVLRLTAIANGVNSGRQSRRIILVNSPYTGTQLRFDKRQKNPVQKFSNN